MDNNNKTKVKLRAKSMVNVIKFFGFFSCMA